MGICAADPCTHASELGGLAIITILIVIAVLLFRVWIAAVLSVGSARQDESGVVFRLGKVQDPARAPKVTKLRPVVDRRTKVNRQVMTLGVPAQDCITKDNMSVRVDAVVYFRVLDVGSAAADNVHADQCAISRLVQTSLRSLIGSAELDDLLSSRGKLRAERTEIIEHHPSNPGASCLTSLPAPPGRAPPVRRTRPFGARVTPPVARRMPPVARRMPPTLL